MDLNICPPEPVDAVAAILRTLGQPVRVQILALIGSAEVCVCHLEAYLGLRQAVISQHLMALREANLVVAERRGRNIYYHLADPKWLDLLHTAAAIAGFPSSGLATPAQPVTPCPCPRCNPDCIDCVSAPVSSPEEPEAGPVEPESSEAGA
jgi:ArsR family transcriptional regulator